MNEKPKDSLPPISSDDLDENSPFNLAFQQWRRSNPLPLADLIRENGITRQFEAELVADILVKGKAMKLRKNDTERERLWLSIYATQRRICEGAPSWDEIYRRISEAEHTTPEAVRELRKRLKIK